MVAINNSINNTVGGSNSGATNTLIVLNSSNTASSAARELISVGGATADDPFTTYTVTGATSWSQGIDNSASDAYVIAASTALGTTNVMSMATTGAVTLPLGDLSVSRANVGQDVFMVARNTDNTNVNSTASLYAVAGGASGGDSATYYQVTGANTWATGLDNSASDAYVIAASNALGTTNVMSMSTAGAVSAVLGNFDVTRSFSGGTVSTTISNTSDTPNSSSLSQITVAGENSGDAVTAYTITGAQTWTVGCDNSNTNAYVISGSTALGVNDVLRLDTASNVNVSNGNVNIVHAKVESPVQLNVSNTDNSDPTSNANVNISVASSGDPSLTFTLSGVQNWALGIDNSASDAFVISPSTTLGSSNGISISTSSNVTIPTGNLDVTRSNAGGDVFMSVKNSNNSNPASNASIYAIAGGTSSGDAATYYQLASGASWATGLDNSASAAYVIAASNTLGTSNALSIATGGDVTIPGGDFAVSRAVSGSQVTSSIFNTSNTANSSAVLNIKTAGTSAGDAFAQFSFTSGNTWGVGLDISDTGAFVIAGSGVLGTNNMFHIDANGYINMPLQPAFLIAQAGTTSNITGDGTIFVPTWDTIIFNVGGFATSTQFTAPIAGKYSFSGSFQLRGIGAGHTLLQAYLVTSARTYYVVENSAAACRSSGNTLIVNWSVSDADMAVTDSAVFEIQVSNSTKTVSFGGGVQGSWFAGQLSI